MRICVERFRKRVDVLDIWDRKCVYHTHTYTQPHTHAHMHTYTHTHTHTHTQTHTHEHARMHALMRNTRLKLSVYLWISIYV